jgi:hypothetical protein
MLAHTPREATLPDAGSVVWPQPPLRLTLRIRACCVLQELTIGLKYLERYIFLIFFNVYVCTFFDKHSSLYQHGGKKLSFKEWILQQNERLGLYSVLDQLQLN